MGKRSEGSGCPKILCWANMKLAYLEESGSKYTTNLEFATIDQQHMCSCV